jgi:hypothetical protein
MEAKIFLILTESFVLPRLPEWSREKIRKEWYLGGGYSLNCLSNMTDAVMFQNHEPWLYQRP